MGQLGDRSEKGTEDARTVEMILQSVSQDLKSLHQGLIVQLSQEVSKLQSEKVRLMSDIEKLQAYHRALQSKQLESLSQQQVAQQQVWAKQLAQLLAVHLQAQIAERLNQIASTNQIGAGVNSPMLPPTNAHSENAHRLLASLDSTFSSTFKALQRELDSYQSSLYQQLDRMQSLEQQGEAILEALIGRLREQLQAESTRLPAVPATPVKEAGYLSGAEVHYPTTSLPPGNGYPLPVDSTYAPPTHAYPSVPESRYQSPSGNGVPPSLSDRPVSPYPTAPTDTPISSQVSPQLSVPASPLPLPGKAPKETSNFQLGLIMVLVSTIALSLHNVVVRIIGKESLLLSWLFGDSLRLGGVITISVLGNSILILWLRMLVVLPLMVPVAMFLYPTVWRDLRSFITARDRRPLFNVVGSGFFLFLSQILIYIAIARIGPGPAVTILFMYPIVTVPLAWILFGDRPTLLRWIVMAVIITGVALTSFGPIKDMPLTGVTTAVGAGVAFALFLIFMQIGFKKLHPIPVTLIQFSTIFVLTSVILILPLNLGVHVDKPAGFLVGGIVLGALTLIGYLTNNFGVKFMGAARASIIASSGPAMTAILALLFVGINLQWWQWLGIVLVTAGVGALSFERMKITPAAAPKPSPDGRR